MRKKEQSIDETAVTANNIRVDQFDYFIGEVFLQLELLGLGDRQIAALKSSLRKVFWDFYNSYVENTAGLVDPSKQARIDAGIEVASTTTSSYSTYYKM